MSYLIVDNNLADLESVYEARVNLGLGNMSTMSSNDVLITGGHISASHFRISPHSNLNISKSNYFLMSSDLQGTVQWRAISTFDWLESDQGSVTVSGFCNDALYISSDALSKAALTGNFLDLCNVPQSLNEIYRDDVLHKFMVIESNLSDIEDIPLARNNIGLGTLAIQNSDLVRVSNLHIQNSWTLPEVVGNGILYVDSFSNVRAMDSFDLATDVVPGLVYTCNINVSTSNSVPTSALLSEMYSNALQNIDSIKLHSVNKAVDLVKETDEFLLKMNALSEYSNDHDRRTVRSNLRLGDLATQSSNFLTIDTLNTNSFYFQSSANVTNKLLSFDESNCLKFADLIEIAQPSLTSPGPVYTIDDFFDYVPDIHSNFSVLTVGGLSNYLDRFETQLHDLISYTPSIVSNQTFLKAENNLNDLQDVFMAKSNLELSKVATTGKYADLTDKPYAISSFKNDTGFLVASSNLADIPDKLKARMNLGLGSMATQDINSVKIKGGYVKFEKLEITKDLFFRDGQNVPNGKILVCTNTNGKMEWKDLPRATFSSFGTVKVSDHVKINDTRTDVVPNCKTFSAIEENITKKLRGALRAYMTSEEFTKKIYLMQEEIANSLINMEETIATQSNIIEQLTAELNT